MNYVVFSLINALMPRKKMSPVWIWHILFIFFNQICFILIRIPLQFGSQERTIVLDLWYQFLCLNSWCVNNISYVPFTCLITFTSNYEPLSLRDKMYDHCISWSLTAAKMGVTIIIKTWHFASAATGAVPRYITNFRATGQLYISHLAVLLFPKILS